MGFWEYFCSDWINLVFMVVSTLFTAICIMSCFFKHFKDYALPLDYAVEVHVIVMTLFLNLLFLGYCYYTYSNFKEYDARQYQAVLRDGKLENMMSCYEDNHYKICEASDDQQWVVEDYWKK